MQPEAGMVFAAGFGTRMGALTRTTPKPLLEVAGRPLLDHALAHLARGGIRRVVVNAHYLAEQIIAHLAGRAGVTVVHETPEILETGGGLRNALRLLGPGPVVTLNPDGWFRTPDPLRALLSGWDGSAEALLLLVPKARALAHSGPGDFDLDADGRLVRRKGEEAPFVYTGLQVIRPDGLHQVQEKAFSLNVLWDDMIARGTAGGVVLDADWVDVGTPQGLALARELAEV